MSRQVQIPVSGEWTQVNYLVQSKLAADNKAEIRPRCSTLEILNDNTDATIPADCRLQVTYDPVTDGGVPIGPGLLPEQSKVWSEEGSVNGTSLLDKWLRLVDNAGLGLVGTAMVELDIG